MGVGEGGGTLLIVKYWGPLLPTGVRGASALAAALSAAVVGHPPSRMHPYTPIDESSAGSGVGWCRGEFSDTD